MSWYTKYKSIEEKEFVNDRCHIIIHALQWVNHCLTLFFVFCEFLLHSSQGLKVRKMLERNIPKKPKNVQNSLQFDEFLKIIAGVVDFESKSWFFPRNYFVFLKGGTHRV